MHFVRRLIFVRLGNIFSELLCWDYVQGLTEHRFHSLLLALLSLTSLSTAIYVYQSHLCFFPTAIDVEKMSLDGCYNKQRYSVTSYRKTIRC